MYIVFNLLKTGLGNNGGSRTILKCAKALEQLGHRVDFVSDTPSRFTWFPHKAQLPHLPPRCDLLIATGISSVKSTLQANAGKKAYYIRGFELWKATERILLKSYRAGLINIVNSEWLQRYMKRKKIPCHLVYPGLDLEDFYIEKNLRGRNKVGMLYNTRKIKRFNWGNFLGEKRITFGNERNANLCRPSAQQLRKFYNRCAIWFAPVTLEGLHNPPMEAGLCGAVLVANSGRRSGMSDYAIHEKTALCFSTRKEAQEQIQMLLGDIRLRRNLSKNLRDLLLTKIGTRRKNMRRLCRIL